MILKNDLDRKWNLGPILWAIPLLALAFIMPWKSGTDSVQPKIRSTQADVIFSCDLEEIEGDFFVSDSFRFDGVSYRTRKEAFSEKHSLRLSSDQPFGLTTTFQPTDYSASYHLTVWRYNPDSVDSWLVAASLDADEFYLADKGKNVVQKDGWEQLHLVFQIPEQVEALKIYCYAGGSGRPVYFDDLRLEITDLSEIADTFQIPRIDLQISEESFAKIKRKRDDAWARGLLVTSDDDWVKAKLSTDREETIKAKIRLKGDWLDHLRGTKWSFRVKIKDPDALWGLKTFNLQRPETRGFLREWLYHQWLDAHDVLTPRYQFVLLSLNGKILGFYALEEHFEKELIEARKRREGPILKFNEARFWAGMNRQFEAMGKGKFPLANNKEDAYWAADVQPFKESAFIDNPDLRKHLDRALELMALYKYQDSDVDKIFDTEILGKYLAIVELTGAYHSLTWHNQRWYYNPLSDKLEPIGFDGFTELPPSLTLGSTILPDEVFRQEKEPFEPFRQFFQSASVLASYTHHLLAFTDSSYQASFIDSLRTQMDTYESLLREEYFNYNIDWRAYRDRIQRIRLSIVPYAAHSMLAQRSKEGQTVVTNTHHLPLKVIGYSNLNRKTVLLDSQVLVLPNVKSSEQISIQLPELASAINYRLPGFDSIFTVDVSPWESVELGRATPTDFKLHPLCAVSDSTVVLKSGTASTSLFIPAGFEVMIPAGTHIDLVDRSYILSESPINAIGAPEREIEVTSSDGTGAVAVRNATSLSTLRYVRFEGLDRIAGDGYLLTGAVTFYNTPVDIMHCSFFNNHQEDALNLVRSEFSLRNSVFMQTAFDAFDADFCDGIVRQCIFRNTGNDAMDFSGSRVSISGCQLFNIGDKGISVGENSTVDATDISIEDAVIGVASKDLSNLTVVNLSLLRIGTGFTAFQKKATYGPAEIYAKNITQEKVKHLHIIEFGSSLTIDGVPMLVN